LGETVAIGLEEIRRKLTEIVSGEFVKLSNELRTLGNGGKLTVYPQDEAEVVEIIKFAHTHELSVIPEGGATKAGLGGTVALGDILLSLKRISGIVDYSVGDLTMTVLPGTPMADIHRALEANGQMFPLDLAWSEESTIGGAIAANSSGPKRLRYGSARDLVIGLRVVYPDGTLIRTGAKVVKNVAGYDMNKLFIGSMGTLGVLTEITVKLRPKPTFESLILIHANEGGGSDLLSKLCDEILDSNMEPAALEVFNPSLSSKLAGRSGYSLLAAFEDVEKSVRYQVNWLKEKAISFGLTIDSVFEGDDAKGWWARYRKLLPIGSDNQIGLKVGTWLNDVFSILEAGTELAGKYNFRLSCHGSAGTGLSHVYLEDISDSGWDDALKLINDLRNLAESKDGYLIVEHAPLRFRQQANVWGETKPTYRLMEGIKMKIDPKGILSPGRFVGGI
jgi:glycolate oxidase FAD binding subunit